MNNLRCTTYLERFCKLFTSYERVHSSLLWRPSLDRIQVEQTLTEIDERRAVVEFCRARSDSHGHEQLMAQTGGAPPQHAAKHMKGTKKSNGNESYLSPSRDPAESST